VLVELEDGSDSYELRDIILKDDPVSAVNDASENNLLDTPGWKRLKHVVKGRQRLNRMIQQTKVNRPQKWKVYNLGILVPINVREAFEIDKAKGNSLWKDAITKEIDNIQAHNTFKDMGRVKFVDGFKKIIFHFVFAVKHDLRHKAWLIVTGGHLTEPTMEGSYSSVVSLRIPCICLVAAELNGIKTMVGDISSAYLKTYTKEKVYFTAGPEFGILEGHTFNIEKSLYGLRTSGSSWHERFSDTLWDLNFKPCLADNDMWIKDCVTHYEYVCVYVDDIMHMAPSLKLLFDSLKDKYGYNLTGLAEPSWR
jgi:Reverse transcriptase (RNA-dependent DNA polymerase)